MKMAANNNMNRFASLNEEQYKELLQDKDSQHTQRSTDRAVKTLRSYCKEKKVSENFENLGILELDQLLAKFYVEARREDGDLYKTGSMLNLRTGICRYLKKERKLDIMKEAEFVEANNAFHATQVKLKKVGKGDTIHYSRIDENDLAKIYSSKVFDQSTPRGLQLKVWFELMVYICRRGRENLRQLTKGHFAINADSEGRRYVYQAVDEMTKKIREDNMSTRVDAGRMYETKTEGCPVASFEKYLSVLNPNCDALFQTPLPSVKPDDRVWFKKSPVGEKTLGSFMGKISTAAKLSRRYTNHSLRSTCISILDSQGFEARDICNISGHRSEASLKSYIGLPCDSKKQQLSDALSSTLSSGSVTKKRKTCNNIPAAAGKAPVDSEGESTPARPSTSSRSISELIPEPQAEVSPDPGAEIELDSQILTDSQVVLLEELNEQVTIAVEADNNGMPNPDENMQAVTGTMPQSQTLNFTSSSVERRVTQLQQTPNAFSNCNVTINYNFHH